MFILNNLSLPKEADLVSNYLYFAIVPRTMYYELYIGFYNLYRKKYRYSSQLYNIGQSTNVVITLLRPYLGKSHTLITDNWYTSPHLYNLLHKYKTNAFGTVGKIEAGCPVWRRT